jgi:hypothetical protein
MTIAAAFRRAAALLAAALLWAAPAWGDVIRLRTGETVKGRVVADRSNEQILTVEDYESGGVREFDWGALMPEDEDKIKEMLGLLGIGELTMPCDVVTYRLQNGAETRVYGVIEGEEGGFLKLRNASSKEPLRIDKRWIISKEKGECDPQVVYRPDELASMWLQDPGKAPADARGWLRYAQYCEGVGAWTQAKEAYEQAAADESFLNRKVAQEGALRIEALIKDEEAIRTINDLKNALGAELWKRVREGIDGFATKHPGAGEPILKRLEGLKAEFAARRAKAMAALAGKRFEPILRELIRKKVQSKEVTFADVQGWLRKECVEEALARLLEELQKRDPATAAEELKGFWDARPKRANSWRLGRYGSGSFIVEPPKQLPRTGSRAPATTGRQGGQQGAAPQMDLPKPPTRDEWWADAPTDVKAEFWFAMFVEKSGLFEVDAKKDRVPCVRCEGDGTLTFTLSNGGAVTVLCPRCGGARFDYAVRYR